VHVPSGPSLTRVASSSYGEGSATEPPSIGVTSTAGSTYLPSRSNQDSLYQGTRLHSLPKLISLEPPREDLLSSTNLPPIVTDAPRMPYSLRRTTNTPHAALLHHDTSKSSRSSDFSNTSSNSAVYTPMSPVEEGRPIHPAPSQTGPGNHFHAPPLRTQPWSATTHTPMLELASSGGKTSPKK
jgi:hypothetical protein